MKARCLYLQTLEEVGTCVEVCNCITSDNSSEQDHIEYIADGHFKRDTESLPI